MREAARHGSSDLSFLASRFIVAVPTMLRSKLSRGNVRPFTRPRLEIRR